MPVLTGAMTIMGREIMPSSLSLSLPIAVSIDRSPSVFLFLVQQGWDTGIGWDIEMVASRRTRGQWFLNYRISRRKSIEPTKNFRTNSSIRSCVTTLPKRGSAAVNGLDQSLSGCVRNGVGSEKRGREDNIPDRQATRSEKHP